MLGATELWTRVSSSLWYSLGPFQEQLDDALQALSDEGALERIWARDGTLWERDKQAIAHVENRLGWLDLPGTMPSQAPRLKAMAAEVRGEGIQHVILLGMGGSSLASEVMRRVLGRAEGYPELSILDSTDPAQIRHIAQVSPLSHTLIIVASKSGLTAEIASLLDYFRAALIAEVGQRWKQQVIAITDPGTKLAALAEGEGFRATILNTPDVGGRYSALSLFGLLPAALAGIDLDCVLARAAVMAGACGPGVPPSANPGMVLGAVMGQLARYPFPGRDKLTIFASPELTPFGPWVEQLIAESTGKEGVGILPVEGECLRQPEQYSRDRVFTYLRLEGADNADNDARVAGLARLGRPVVVLALNDAYDLGAEFFRWEFATSVASQLLGINPFDQPDVEAAKVQARNGLAQYEETRALAEEPALFQDGRLSVYGLDLRSKEVSSYLRAFLAQASEGGYIAIMAYVERSDAHAAALQRMRCALSERMRLAVTLGFGPRFLHSTGQLHKGGRNVGLFLQLTQDEPDDLPIPGRPYTFGILKHAQALGDYQALRSAGRHVIRVNLGPDVAQGLDELAAVVGRAL